MYACLLFRGALVLREPDFRAVVEKRTLFLRVGVLGPRYTAC